MVVVEEDEDEVLRGGKAGGPTLSTISPMHSRLQSSTSSSAQKRQSKYLVQLSNEINP